MNTLDDIREFRDKPYGLVHTYNIFRPQTSTKFSGSEREWHGVPQRCDEILETRYGKRWDEADWPVMPLLAAVRHSILEAFEEMPSDIDECTATLEDAIVTLNTVESLDAASPFLRNARPSPVVKKLEEAHLEEAHISTVPLSAVALEDDFTKQWNARRAKQRLKPLRPLDDTQLRHMLLGRDDTIGVKMHTRGDDDQVSGYFVLREPVDGARGLDLIAYAVDDDPGFAEALASLLVLRMQYESFKRIRTMLEESHGKRLS